MTVEQFLSNATHVEGLYVNGTRHWSNMPVKGYEFKTREEILNVELVEEPEEEKIKLKKSKK